MPQTAERLALSEGLAKLNENMATLAELSKVAIRKAVETLEAGKRTEAEAVFTLDQEIFGLKNEITRSCVDLIALHAPVARDLRAITASLEITIDLDRIGRYSRDIAEIANELPPEALKAVQRIGRLARMGELTIRMIDLALDAFEHRDADPVRNMIQEDDAVDTLHDELFHEIVTRMADRSLTPQVGAQLILLNRYFERTADHAVNIGDHVAYMVTGQRLTRVKRPKSGLPLGLPH
ncbi:MAG TPA: phosphate signaling complex protein PhoU [Thermoplasmata archaeon]|nr:phosphate signaling complex protein PhoU [Thermoplasmata archaeon]